MKSRKRTIGMAVGIAVVAALLCALFWQVNRFKVKPSLYADAAVRQGVTVQVETNWAKDEILYLLENRTAEQIEYAGYEVLEYYDGQVWQEVLYRMGGRACEQTRDARRGSLRPQGRRTATGSAAWIWQTGRAGRTALTAWFFRASGRMTR